MDKLKLFLNRAWEVINYPIKLGGTEVTLGGLLLLVGLFALVIILERLLRKFFILRLLRRTPLDESFQYGIGRILGYLVVVVGWYVAFQVVGIDLSSLAFIAGAVGVGVGFGLQNIINNFVSGIIILAERPIAIGDRIEVSGIAGRVVKISLRSTTVVTNDNITMIVPNADFISQTVTNWSHGDLKVRIRIPIGVAYGTDPELVQKLLLEVACEHPKTLEQPKPVVLFDAFGDNSLNFELAAWTAEMTTRPKRYMSELNFAIEKKLRENYVEIPFPQRDIHIRSGVLETKKAAGEKSAAPV